MPTGFSPDEWARAEAILDAVFDLDPAARAAALDRTCGNDLHLRARIESLLAADEDASMFLETPAAEYAAGLVRAATDGGEPDDVDTAGDLIGPYRLIKEIGHGGMGRVFLAVRADGQFEQQVALKVVRGAQSSREILQRFLRERQILARLQHPHIARLLDGGVSADGRPYFAMEHVVGEPITTYCDARALGIAARLDLFANVCDAVQYAHQNLVVHRDLKPSNTLVTSDGEVKLLDFGIAKVLHEDDEGIDATLTRLGSGPMTPEYATPEQVQGEPVTTATDVYALGALAYELFTGRGPHRLAKLTAVEVQRAITEQDVERPSSAVAHGDSGGRQSDIARARGTDQGHLRRELRGDLDTILLKALQRDPRRRYASAGALVEDLRRYRAGLPIAARRDSLSYRTGKFVRRHAIGVAATAVIVVSLVAGLISTVWQARVASREAAKAREVSRFLASLFEVADPALANASHITARELLDRGASRIETDLAAQPDVQAEMMTLLGRIYRELSLFERAQPLLDKSLALRRATAGRDTVEVAATLSELGQLSLEAGHPDTAERLQREALTLRRRLLPRDHPDVGNAMRELAEVLNFEGKYDEAEALQRDALALHQRAFGAEHAEVANDLEGLQTILRNRGQTEPAIAASRQVLAMRLKLLGTDHLETVTAMNNLANLLREKWALAEAEQLYRQVLAFDLRRLGQVHSNTATVTNNLAGVLRDRGQYDESERLYRSALDLDRQLFGDEHYYVATVLTNLASVLAARQQYDEAERHFREALAMFRRTYGDNHWQVGWVEAGLAGVLSAKNDPAAQPTFRQALGRLEASLSSTHPRLEPALIGLGRDLTTHGSANEAEPLLRRAVDSRRKRLGDADPRTAEAQVWLAACLVALDRQNDAEPLLKDAAARLRDEPRFSTEASEAQRLLDYARSRR
jgi:eukaryotic-like serine/threonine-protein kinase